MRFRIIQLSLAILFLLSQTVVAGQKIRYKFEKEKNYKYSTTVESKVSGQAMGQEFTMTSAANVDYSITNADLKDNIYSLIVTFDRFDVKLNFPLMGFKDSTIALKDFIGKRVKLTVTDLGKTLSVEPIDTIQPSRIQAIANLTPNELFKHILMQIPDKELDINSTWKNDVPDTTVRGGMKMISKQNIEMRVVGTEKKADLDCWKISMNGVNTIEGSGSQRGNDVTIDGSNKITGATYLAPKEGILAAAESSIETDITTTVTGSNTGASTMIVNTTSKTTLIK